MRTVEIPLRGGHAALVDAAVAPLLLRYTWRSEVRGPVLYACRSVPVGGAGSRYMHKLLTGWSRTDHINGDGLDNRRDNLRPANHSQNAGNGHQHRDGTSGFKGVTWHGQRQRWAARISVRGSHFHLGLFPTPESAAEAYDDAARTAFGEFAALNFPGPGERSALIRAGR